MRAFLRKWGNSLGVRIPKVFAVHMGMKEGQEVEVNIEENKLVIGAAATTLDALLREVREENLHGEEDMGVPVGKEVW